MADTLFSHDMGEHHDASRDAPRGNSLVFFTNVTAAVVSLALIAGVAVWGYKLLVRDVSGIPVVRAASGEMRVLPEDPGGVLAQHQGLAVNAVAAKGAAAKPADRLILAPRDVVLAPEDQPVVTQALEPVEQPVALKTADEALGEAAREPALDREALQAASINEIVGQLTGMSDQAEPINKSTSARVVQAKTVSVGTEPTVGEETEVLPLATPGVAQSKRPQLRPASAPAVVVPAAYAPEAETREIDAAAIPAGTRLAQLGAYESAEVARAEWDRMQDRFGDYLNGKSRVVQRAQTGGRTFFRLRAMGFTDLSDARRFCSALVAENADCIPVVSR